MEPKAPPRSKSLKNRDLRPKAGKGDAAASTEEPLTLAEVPSAFRLQKQKVDYLRKMASKMGIATKGLKKSDLIAAIVFELQG